LFAKELSKTIYIEKKDRVDVTCCGTVQCCGCPGYESGSGLEFDIRTSKVSRKQAWLNDREKHYEHQGKLGCDGKKSKEMDRLKEEKQMGQLACLLVQACMVLFTLHGL
jgi:hypothetical protein